MSNPTIHISSLTDPPPRHPTYIAVGVFDGVHLGHQALLKQLVTTAQMDGARSAVLTFFPHPIVVLKGMTGRLYLQPLANRVVTLTELGIELIISQPFDESVRQMPADDFVAMLQTKLDMRQLWGGDFSLGHNRQGDYDYLRQLGAERGFSVHLQTGLTSFAGNRVSSSRVRRALDEGDLATVTGCLGRHYEIAGKVIEGRRLGRTIGFPTANLAVWEEQLLPANGVYAAYAYLHEKKYRSAVNIGIRPTVGGSSLTVEAHLLDFEGDIYGEELKLAFVSRIREEKKFTGMPALSAQIQQDVTQAKQKLG